MSGLSTTRLDQSDDTTTVVFTDIQSLSRRLRDRSIFDMFAHRIDEDTETASRHRTILRSLYVTVDYGPEQTVRIATALQDEDSRIISEQNLYYYETTISEREPIPEEEQVYEDSFHDCPSPVMEFEMPPLDAFQNPADHEAFETAFEPVDRLHALAIDLQEDIETRKWRDIQANHSSTRPNLEPEYNPDYDGNDKEEVKGFNKGYYYGAREGFSNVTRLAYHEYLEARLILCNDTYKHLDASERVLFECVPRSENETFCPYCGTIDATEQFLTIEDKLEREKRVCINCATHWSDFRDETVDEAIENHDVLTLEDKPFQLQR